MKKRKQTLIILCEWMPLLKNNVHQIVIDLRRPFPHWNFFVFFIHCSTDLTVFPHFLRFLFTVNFFFHFFSIFFFIFFNVSKRCVPTCIVLNCWKMNLNHSKVKRWRKKTTFNENDLVLMHRKLLQRKKEWKQKER